MLRRQDEGRRFKRVSRLLLLGLLLVTAAPARAGGNDLTLWRLAECNFVEHNGQQVCTEVVADTAGFEAISRDLGLAFSPKGTIQAETLGEAGFEYAFEIVFNVADRSTESWNRATEGENPGNLMTIAQFHIRKGLPFSFELGAVASHLFDSGMWALGAELTWALHEDTLWPLPDFGVRGFANTVVGASDLNLTTGGFDAILSFPVGIANSFRLTPYAGYNFTAVFSSTGLLDATPDDTQPPIEGGGGQPSMKPEFVFDSVTNTYNRFVGGLQFRYTILNATFETVVAPAVQSYTLHVGVDF